MNVNKLLPLRMMVQKQRMSSTFVVKKLSQNRIRLVPIHLKIQQQVRYLNLGTYIPTNSVYFSPKLRYPTGSKVQLRKLSANIVLWIQRKSPIYSNYCNVDIW